ncbi:hypothetical protein M434DRAFT_173911 [Hypoxylon sp. CO27-5]|nr:hypothetical protein M434DRAFT_173911 [Hypoxylon sp. CO27-5]
MWLTTSSQIFVTANDQSYSLAPTDMISLQIASNGVSSIAIACLAALNICFRAVSSLLARILCTESMKSAEDFTALSMLYGLLWFLNYLVLSCCGHRCKGVRRLLD